MWGAACCLKRSLAIPALSLDQKSSMGFKKGSMVGVKRCEDHAQLGSVGHWHCICMGTCKIDKDPAEITARQVKTIACQVKTIMRQLEIIARLSLISKNDILK